MDSRLIVNLLLSLVSLAVSAAFITGGPGLLFGGQPPHWMSALGPGASAYGFLSAAFLVTAWFWSDSLLEKFARALMLLALAMVMYFSMDKGGTAWMEIAIGAVMVGINWLAVQRVVARESAI